MKQFINKLEELYKKNAEAITLACVLALAIIASVKDDVAQLLQGNVSAAATETPTIPALSCADHSELQDILDIDIPQMTADLKAAEDTPEYFNQLLRVAYRLDNLRNICGSPHLVSFKNKDTLLFTLANTSESVARKIGDSLIDRTNQEEDSALQEYTLATSLVTGAKTFRSRAHATAHANEVNTPLPQEIIFGSRETANTFFNSQITRLQKNGCSNSPLYEKRFRYYSAQVIPE